VMTLLFVLLVVVAALFVGVASADPIFSPSAVPLPRQEKAVSDPYSFLILMGLILYVISVLLFLGCHFVVVAMLKNVIHLTKDSNTHAANAHGSLLAAFHNLHSLLITEQDELLYQIRFGPQKKTEEYQPSNSVVGGRTRPFSQSWTPSDSSSESEDEKEEEATEGSKTPWTEVVFSDGLTRRAVQLLSKELSAVEPVYSYPPPLPPRPPASSPTMKTSQETETTQGKADVRRRRGERRIPTVAQIKKLAKGSHPLACYKDYKDAEGRMYLNADSESEFIRGMLEEYSMHPKAEFYWVYQINPTSDTPLNPEIGSTMSLSILGGGDAKDALIIGNGAAEFKPGTRAAKSTYAVLTWVDVNPTQSMDQI
jgi:hypothetical protein